MADTNEPGTFGCTELVGWLSAKSVQVQCDGVNCLAYRDEKGLWRNYQTRELLRGTVRLRLTGPDGMAINKDS